jgi:hypothetical protein
MRSGWKMGSMPFQTSVAEVNMEKNGMMQEQTTEEKRF